MGPWYVSRAVVPVLRKAKGAITNVGPVAGIVASGSSLRTLSQRRRWTKE